MCLQFHKTLFFPIARTNCLARWLTDCLAPEILNLAWLLGS